VFTVDLQAVMQDGTTPADADDPTLLPYGQDVTWTQWADGRVDVTCVGQDGVAFDITGGALILSVRIRPGDAAAIISREATIVSAEDGTAYFPIGSDDVGITARTYGYTVTYIDSDGKIWPVVPLSVWCIEPSDYVPGDAVTVPTSQDPLAQGPQGEAGPVGPGNLTVTAVKTTTYTAAAGELVLCDPTSAGFTVTLPTAVGVSGQTVAVKNASDSYNLVTVATTSAQTIDGASTYEIDGPRYGVRFVSDGANWVVI
jgi:hypothetical protein